MRNVISGLILLFLGSILLNNCLNSAVKKSVTDGQSLVNKLRKLYSSGDVSKWPAAELDASVKKNFKDIGHLSEIKFPEDNPHSQEKVLLGKTLFYDPRLSGSNQIACASCHDPELAWTDNKTLSFGHDRQLGSRNAMTILNIAHATSLFWDGRAKSLEEQSSMPIIDQREMNEHIDLATGKISKIKGYEILFEKAFGDKNVTTERINKAIATFERTVKSGSTKFDRFIDGKSEAFTDDEVIGLHLFRTKAQCINCHNSGYFSNNEFENDGTAILGAKKQDLGRYLITKKLEDVGKFRIPTLREISRTGPWMHHGVFTSLTDVIRFYNAGNPEAQKRLSTIYNGITLNSQKSPMLKKLNLTEKEIQQLEAFLGTLRSRTVRLTPPTLPQ
ncbi:cytochrome-c peroxidase [Epilithonimonas lactis]|uniref:Methylamine utilization protein MauG n=1 Tax=Epilithonimonas lactis TaxID=421072 RepID=A0A085B7E4_9FLAO|nr:cytochrome c peroxidase [Epilithonimonas lactis]KFC18389.1 cytochrome C peroxidase [Epilithonimonas lactis]SER02776.1 cytochrome c peroxidase [Epilithonimonas lactis]